MRTIDIALPALLLISTFHAGCGDAVLTGPSSVVGGVWKLQSLETSSGLVGITLPDRYTVEFRDGGVLSAKADCNACSGAYSIVGEMLRIGPMACTRAFCGSTSHDEAFLDILGSASRMGVRGVELSIESPKGLARFNR